MDNSLGLDVTGTTDAPQPDPVPKGDDEPASPAPPTPAGATPKSPPIDKKVPYVNKNRVQTGGAPREKLSPEELEARMAEIRKRNQQIKEKRELVLADEAAFKQELAQDQAATKQREDNTRKVQAKVNHERGQNAQRKLEKMGGREWDSAKADDWSPGQGQGRRPPPRKRPTDDIAPSPADGSWKQAQQEHEQKPDKPYKHVPGKKPRKTKTTEDGENDKADGDDSIDRSESSSSEDEQAGENKDKKAGGQRGGKSARGAERGRGRGGKKVSSKARARRTSASTDEEGADVPSGPIAVILPKTPPGGFKPLEVDVQQTNWAGDVIDQSGW